MDLHRASRQPDWENVAAAQRNAWQRLAANTDGIITPGNFFTLLGLAGVIVGLALVQHHAWWTFGLLLTGRLMDLADGLAAQGTGTKSHLGEIFDATSDKVGTFLTLIALAAVGAAPWWLMALMALPQAIVGVVVTLAYHRRQVLHPSLVGKLSMAAVWVGLMATVLALATGISWIKVVAEVIVMAAIIFGLMAAGDYIGRSLRPTSQPT